MAETTNGICLNTMLKTVTEKPDIDSILCNFPTDSEEQKQPPEVFYEKRCS